MAILTPWMLNWLQQAWNISWLLNINPEFWHRLAMMTSNSAERIDFIVNSLKEALYFEDSRLETQVWNMTCRNQIWLAAWFAKQSHWLKLLEAFWFGYITIWWITVNAQEWNLKPRIFKFPESQSMVNGMWLPWDGLENEVKRLAKRKELWLMPNIPIIANLCNSLLTQAEDKTDEFLFMMDKLYPYVDWFEINVSCPNQCWVTSMQKEKVLKDLLIKVTQYNKLLALRNLCERKTILVKIAPLTKYENEPERIKDLSKDGLEIIANVCNEVWIDWVTATNTSQEHEYDTKIIKPDWSIIKWWLSWLWLHEQSLKTVSELRKVLNRTIPIIWVWWIWYDAKESWLSAINMLDNWAWALWLMSCFIQNSVVSPYWLKQKLLEHKIANNKRENSFKF